MLDEVFKDRDRERELPSPPSSTQKKPFLSPALTLPLLFLVLIGSIIYFFGLLSFDDKSPFDLIGEIRTGAGDRRALAAYELSRFDSYDLPGRSRPEFVALTVRTFHEEAGGDPEIRRALALTLGRIGDAAAVPDLILSLEDPDTETQLYAVWALGAIGDRRAVGPVLSKLGQDDAGVRKMAAFALGQIGDSRAASGLRIALQDRTADVSWNAAVALARMGDRTGLPILLPLLDRGQLATMADLTSRQREDLVITVVRSLRSIREEPVTRTLRNLADHDPSARVRGEARNALEGRWDPSASPGPAIP